MRKKILAGILLISGLTCYSQTDSVIYTQAIENALQQAPSSESIFNGRENLEYPANISGIPYVGMSDWHKGSIVYRDKIYIDVHLKYNAVADEVVIRHPNGFTGIILFNPRISSFTLSGRRFVSLPESPGIAAGLYEEITTGSLSLYIKRSKIIEEKYFSSGAEIKFTDKDAYFVLSDGVFHRIKREKDLMELVKEMKNEIKSYLKKLGLKYRKNPEVVLFESIEYYNKSKR